MGNTRAAMSFFGPLIVLTGAIYVLFCFLLFLMQSKLLYYPNLPGRTLQTSPADIGLDYESVLLTTSDTIQIHGWFIEATNPRGTLLFFHGNAGNISHRLDSIKIFNNLGLSTFIIDYRGYGQSKGTVTEKGTYLDAEAAWQYLVQEKKTDPAKIIVFGRSLGGAVAANLAANHQMAGLILESAFTSVPDMAAKLYPFLPVRLLSRYNYNTKKALAHNSAPLLIVHSKDDDIIPYENGLKLFASAKEPKKMLTINGDHNQGFLVSGSLYTDGLKDFLADVLEKRVQ